MDEGSVRTEHPVMRVVCVVTGTQEGHYLQEARQVVRMNPAKPVLPMFQIAPETFGGTSAETWSMDAIAGRVPFKRGHLSGLHCETNPIVASLCLSGAS